MTRKLVAVAAALQIGIGILLLVGTAGLAGTAYRTIREESGQLATNLVAAADALESARGTYAQSATNLFVLTDSMEDVGDKLDAVSGKISGTGKLFSNQATKCEEFACHLKWTVFKQEISIAKPFLSLAAWCRNSGRQFSDIGDDRGIAPARGTAPRRGPVRGQVVRVRLRSRLLRIHAVPRERCSSDPLFQKGRERRPFPAVNLKSRQISGKRNV